MCTIKTQGRCTLTVIVNFEKRGNYTHYIASFDLKEYSKTNATYTSGEQITFKTKIGDEISEDVLVGSPPNGSLTLGASEYSWGADDFYNALYECKDVRCIITIGTSEYQFTATGDNFSSVCEQNGYGIAAEDLTVKEAVKILVEDYCLYNRYAGDWIKKNTDKLELMKTDEIQQLMEGYFLKISAQSGYVKDDYMFPLWWVKQYSQSRNTQQTMAMYDFDSSYDMSSFIEEVDNGKTVAGYDGYRTYKKITSSEAKEMVIENDVVTITNSDNEQMEHQIYRITDNIYVMIDEDQYKTIIAETIIGAINFLLCFFNI